MWSATEVFSAPAGRENDPNWDNYFASITLDSKGLPHIPHYANLFLVYLYQTDSGIWETRGSGYWTPSDYWNVSPIIDSALDSNDNPYFVYPWYSDFPANRIKLSYRNAAGGWSHVPGISTVRGVLPSIKLDSNDKFHISYNNWGSPWALNYVYGTPEGFIREAVDSSGQESSVVVDYANKPHISYWYDTTKKLKYAYKTAETWVKEVVDPLVNVGRYTSMAVDAGGRPHFSYYDITNNTLKYAYKKPDGTWVTVTVDSGNVGKWTSIALDSNGKPHITYFDALSNTSLRYARYLGSEGSWANGIGGIKDVDPGAAKAWWFITTVASGAGGPNAIALDAANRPHISYVDKTLTKRRYATLTR